MTILFLKIYYNSKIYNAEKTHKTSKERIGTMDVADPSWFWVAPVVEDPLVPVLVFGTSPVEDPLVVELPDVVFDPVVEGEPEVLELPEVEGVDPVVEESVVVLNVAGYDFMCFK